jgi:transposase-like protein
MTHENGASRRTREQWQQLVAAWRRSRRPAADFARELGVVESTLRWWAWRLERDYKRAARPGAPVALVPVRLVGEPAAGGEDSDGGRLAWTLRTSRGELTVYSAGESALLAAVASLVGGGA